MKKIIFSALLMGFVVVSFAGNPKDAKNTNGTEAKAKQNLVWYKVTYNATYPNGAVLSSADYVDEGEESQISSPCDEGTQRDCVRGFSSAPSFPTTSNGDGQIKTDEQP